jgi:multiple antibiotic resistance protein
MSLINTPSGLQAILIYLLLIASMPLRQALGELQEKVISRL